MNLFNNQERSGYEEIVSYGPRWWTEYREMDANYRFAGWTLDLMAHFLEQEVKNQFPSQADEQAIRTFERLLRIEPAKGESLAARIRTVMAYYSGTGKLSSSAIQSIISSYSNCTSELYWEASILVIRIYCEDEEFTNSKIYDLLKRRIPAHIAFYIREVLAIFELEEMYVVNRIKYYMPIIWWNGRIDGSHCLDGSILFDAEYPTRFFARFLFVAQIGEEFSFFQPEWKFVIENNEQIRQILSMIGYRMPVTWWKSTLDGSGNLDGEVLINTELPPYWLQRHRISFAVQENFQYQMIYLLPEVKNVLYDEFMSSHRVILNWWEGFRTLDGGEQLDGNGNLDQTVSSAWDSLKFFLQIKSEEQVTVSMYTPSLDVLLNGSALLDGKIKINSGREEL